MPHRMAVKTIFHRIMVQMTNRVRRHSKALEQAEQTLLSVADWLFYGRFRTRRFMLVLPFVAAPLLLIASFQIMQPIFANKAQASIGFGGGLSIASMSDAEIQRSAREIRGRILRNPDRLTELSQEHILILMDKPDLSRNEGSVRHWQYASGACVMDIFIANGAQKTQAEAQNSGAHALSDAGRVLYYQIRPRQTAHLIPAKDSSANEADANFSQKSCLQLLSQRRVGKGVLAVAALK